MLSNIKQYLSSISKYLFYRTVVNSGNGNTDLTITIFKHKAEIVMRLKYSLPKIQKRTKPISISDVVKVQIAHMTETDKNLTIKNSLSCYSIANSLYKTGAYRDAFLYYHLSLEHYLKCILAKKNQAYFIKYLDTFPLSQDSKGKSNEKSHDLISILIHLQQSIDDFGKNVSISPLIQSLVKAKKNYEWSEIRYYSDPSDASAQNNFKQYCKDLKLKGLTFRKEIKKLGLDI